MVVGHGGRTPQQGARGVQVVVAARYRVSLKKAGRSPARERASFDAPAVCIWFLLVRQPVKFLLNLFGNARGQVASPPMTLTFVAWNTRVSRVSR